MEFLDPFETDPLWPEASVIARTDGMRWLAAPMGFNFRMIGIVEQRLIDGLPEYGWCYPHRLALILAAQVFDPDTEDEPLGWHKRAGSPRQAAGRAAKPEYNRPRCVHGSYLHAAVCAQDQFCPEMTRTRGRRR